MSRRGGYTREEIYEERDREYYPRPPRTERNYDELDIDIKETRTRGPERRAETVLTDRRAERGARLPDFLRDDYGKTVESQQLVIREERRDDDGYSRAPTRRRSNESLARSRVPERVEKEEIIIRERERDRRPPYPSSDVRSNYRDIVDKEEIIFRDQVRERAPSRAPSRGPGRTTREEIDINIRRDDDVRSVAPPRSEIREKDIEEIRFRRGGGDRPPPQSGRVVEREEIDIRETRRSSPPRSEYRPRGREEESREEIDIRIRETERSAPPPRARSASRGNVVAREKEEWIVRRRREPSPPPPPRDFEKEEIIIRRRERTRSPSPIREPTPPPLPAPAPPLEPIVRPPIVQEVITHYRNIDHGFERARSPSPPPPPPSPPREKEDNLEIAIHRTGTRNGKAYDEDLIIQQDRMEREDDRAPRRAQSVGTNARRRSPSAHRRYENDDVADEADYYNRRVTSRGYPGEAYNGATRDWGLVDIPPGTERVRMDGTGGGAQEITWQRYNGERKSKFYAGDRVYEQEFGRDGLRGLSPAPPPPALAPPREEKVERIEETRIERRITTEEKPKTKDRMWTEVTKDLVIKEAIDEMGYEFEETGEFYYVMEYLRYEDVLKLVELTEDIRRERRERIREIQWEREELERLPKLLAPPPPPIVPAPPRTVYDERIYEREYHYDRDGRRSRR